MQHLLTCYWPDTAASSSNEGSETLWNVVLTIIIKTIIKLEYLTIVLYQDTRHTHTSPVTNRLISIFVHLGQPSGQQTENMSDDVEMQERVNEDGDPIIHGDLIRWDFFLFSLFLTYKILRDILNNFSEHFNAKLIKVGK